MGNEERKTSLHHKFPYIWVSDKPFFYVLKLVNFNFSQIFLNYDKRLAIENIFPLQIMQFL